ncbi:hypothetical protein B932_1681 [Gluconobacter oxydans H24]|nr:hypothetical protein B932_1681 [Gluconobacter oxydans H24]
MRHIVVEKLFQRRSWRKLRYLRPVRTAGVWPLVLILPRLQHSRGRDIHNRRKEPISEIRKARRNRARSRNGGRRRL